MTNRKVFEASSVSSKRFYSIQHIIKPTGNVQSFQSALKKFYLHVHPDLFTDKPEVQKVNDDNFKKFTQYLDNYKAGSEKREYYDIEFYSKHAGEGDLRLIKAKLELPSKHSSIETLETVFKKNVGKLFSQCNIEDFDVTGYGMTSRVLRSAGKNEISLINMIISASTRLKKSSSSQEKVSEGKAELQASTKKIQASIKSKLNASFSLEVPSIMFPTSLSKYSNINSWFKKLESCIDSLDKSALQALDGRKIIFASGKSGITSVGGPIYLEINDSLSMWFETLSNCNREQEETFIKNLNEVHALEAAVDRKSVV